jgi:predicted amidohydrolase
VAQEPNELRWDTDTRGGRRLYRIAPKNDVDWGGRIAAILRRLDEQGAVLGVMPELTLNDHVVTLWRRAIVKTRAPVDSRLAWILIGTGPLGEADPPPNRAVVMCRRTGRVLLTQDKCHPFFMSGELIRDWGLEGLLGTEPANEDIARGERVTIAESAVGRFVTLVCEDLARIVQLGQPLLDHGVSHALAPVFSKPTVAHYWEHSAAKTWAQAIGTQVIVSNSLVVASTMGVDLPAGMCLAHGPEGFHADAASEHDDVRPLRITADVGVRILGNEGG